ncbi:MAG: hypothetical protein FWE17_00145 [Alphaproteobacteria bacterium]|nr:hypothetical protein [Alphaproteobacteria bacterium]MCL2757815.1 hypothetical protein [Alphaproteobacteria bacterium]
MKKLTMFSFALLLSACGGMIRPEQGSKALVRFNEEPTGCTFVYRLEVDVSAYAQRDAEQFLRNRIIAQQRQGNAFRITAQSSRPNPGAIFGPKNSFILDANIYDCPHL